MRSLFLNVYNWIISPLPFAKSSIFKFLWLRYLCGIKIGRRILIKSNVRIYGVGDVVIGDDVELCEGVILQCNGGVLRIGNHVEINQNSIIAANFGSSVRIGDNVRIAHMVSIKGSTHEIALSGVSIAGRSIFDDIVIGAGSWLCAGVTIIPGVRIGARTCVAAGAVVVRDTPDNSLVAGVPAIVKKIYTLGAQ